MNILRAIGWSTRHNKPKNTAQIVQHYMGEIILECESLQEVNQHTPCTSLILQRTAIARLIMAQVFNYVRFINGSAPIAAERLLGEIISGATMLRQQLKAGFNHD
jgi:hypothetical protein